MYSNLILYCSFHSNFLMCYFFLFSSPIYIIYKMKYDDNKFKSTLYNINCNKKWGQHIRGIANANEILRLFKHVINC